VLRKPFDLPRLLDLLAKADAPRGTLAPAPLIDLINLRES